MTTSGSKLGGGQCPFCDVAGHIIDENDFANVIFSNPRLTEYHLLIIPKRHVEKPWELTKNERQAIFDLILKWQKFIIDHIATGCDVRENYRPFLPQSKTKVDHLHYHLLPREFRDELFAKSQIYEAEIFREVKREELDPRHLL